jgi:glycosyltransferase involved in cell wall biosynthesis
MKILVDFAFTIELSEPGAAFFEHLMLLYAKQFTSDELVIVTSMQQNQPLADNSHTIYLKATGFNWLKTSRLNNIVQQQNPDAIIRFEKEQMLIFKRKKNKPVASVAFTNQHYGLFINKSIHTKKNLPPVVISSSQTLNWSEKESLKISYTAGREYFLMAGNVDTLTVYITILKAFSQFKKRQLSDMKLLLITEENPLTEELEEKLKTYKYRHDVEVIGQPEPEVFEKLMHCAYAYIDVNTNNELSFPILMAAQTDTAVIAAATAASKQLAPAASYFSKDNIQEELYDAISLLYKDENLKNTLASRNKTEACKINANTMLQELRDFIVSQV